MTVYFLIVYLFSAGAGPLLIGQSYKTFEQCREWSQKVAVEYGSLYRNADCVAIVIPEEALK